MGKRGPKPAGAAPTTKARKKLRHKPLPGMPEQARHVWKRVTDSLPADFFRKHHLDQLRAYCQAAALNKEAGAKIAIEGAVVTQKNGVVKANPWVAVQTASAAVMAQMGTKLGLTKNSMLASRGGDTKPPVEKGTDEFGDLIGGTHPNQQPRREDGPVH